MRPDPAAFAAAWTARFDPRGLVIDSAAYYE